MSCKDEQSVRNPRKGFSKCSKKLGAIAEKPCLHRKSSSGKKTVKFRKEVSIISREEGSDSVAKLCEVATCTTTVDGSSHTSSQAKSEPLCKQESGKNKKKRAKPDSNTKQKKMSASSSKHQGTSARNKEQTRKSSSKKESTRGHGSKTSTKSKKHGKKTTTLITIKLTGSEKTTTSYGKAKKPWISFKEAGTSRPPSDRKLSKTKMVKIVMKPCKTCSKRSKN